MASLTAKQISGRTCDYLRERQRVECQLRIVMQIQHDLAEASRRTELDLAEQVTGEFELDLPWLFHDGTHIFALIDSEVGKRSPKIRGPLSISSDGKRGRGEVDS